MSVAYRAVQWNRHKAVYDAVLVGAVIAYVAVFVGVGMVRFNDGSAHPVTLLMRATSSCAFVLLTVVLCIGPLARLSPRFAPLLYNRRHLGVTVFLVGFVHGVLAIFWYHGFGVVNPLVSVLTSNANYLPDLAGGQGWRSWLAGFPFQPLGVAALAILFLMAATSHDFWLKQLSPRVWKNVHAAVYAAYGLLVMHVTLGFLQGEVSPVYAAALALSVLCVSGLHLVAGLREWRRDTAGVAVEDGVEWVDVSAVEEVPDGGGRVVCLAGRERVALFREGDRVYAMSNVCAHQGGPLGEGRIVGGCVTCPWHGYQYRPEDGQSPPPYTERVPTYRVTVEGGRVLLDPRPLPPGTNASDVPSKEQRDASE